MAGDIGSGQCGRCYAGAIPMTDPDRSERPRGDGAAREPAAVELDDTLQTPLRTPLDTSSYEPAALLVIAAHPRPFLVGRHYPIPEGSELVVGRASDAQVNLADANDISRRHLLVWREAGMTQAQDLGSRNGTLRNGAPLTTPVALVSGDVLQLGSVLLRYVEGAEQGLYAALYEHAVRDELTGAFNRLRFAEEVARSLAMAHRHGRPATLIVFDVDRFAQVNERHGRDFGDHLLQQLVELLEPLLRREATFARLEADELAILCPETPIGGAMIFVERLRWAVAAHVFRRDAVEASITCSFGLVELTADLADPQAAYRLAAAALARSRAEGGDRVTVAPPAPATPR